jgi:hypothetical protein
MLNASRLLRRLAASALFGLAVAAPARVAAAPGSSPGFAGPTRAGTLAAPPRQETSGLAPSHRAPDVLWTHDDSGGAAALYAISTTGAKVGVLRIHGVKNEDWEDVASFELAGKPCLLIADTGDNDAQRPTVLLHLVEEPPLEQLRAADELGTRPIRTLRVRYEDGPRDCEAVAVDPQERAVYLLTKRDQPARLYRVELEPQDGNAIVLARRVGTVARIPQPTSIQQRIKGHLGRRRAEVTAMDFAPDGRSAVVLTYGDLLLFPRQPGERWAEALAREPNRLPPPDLGQQEAACFSADGRQIYVASESARPLLRYDRQ